MAVTAGGLSDELRCITEEVLAGIGHDTDAPPHTVRIGAIRYTIELVDRAELGDYGRVGECNVNTATIRVADNRPDAVLAETLIHEVLHALFHDIGLDWEAEDEERMVERMSPRLAALIGDNPALFEYLADAFE